MKFLSVWIGWLVCLEIQLKNLFFHNFVFHAHNILIYFIEDKLVWKVENNLGYSIESAYRLCVEELINTFHICWTGYWSGIWHLKVPSKIMNLIWRMCWGCFPTRVRIQDKCVRCPTICVMCDGPSEYLTHVCFGCPFVVHMWCKIGIWDTIHNVYSGSNSTIESIFALLHNIIVREFSMFCCCALDPLDA